MKKFIPFLFLSACFLMGCPDSNQADAHDHGDGVHTHEDGSTHSHDGHSHDADGHTHDGDDHHHEQEEFTIDADSARPQNDDE